MDMWEIRDEIIDSMAEVLANDKSVPEATRKRIRAYCDVKRAEARVEALSEEEEETREASAAGETVKEHVSKVDGDEDSSTAGDDA